MAKLSLPELSAFVSALITANKISNSTFDVTRNNTVGLLDKVAKIFTLDTNYEDKLAELGGEDLSYGKILEEWQEDLIMPQDYDSAGSGALQRADGTYRPVFYSYPIPRKKIKTTIGNNDIERAVHNAEQFASIITMKSKRLYDSELVYKYDLKRELIGKFIGLCESEMTTNTNVFTPSTTDYAVNTIVVDNATPTKHGIIVKAFDHTSVVGVTNWATGVSKGYIIELDLISVVAKPVDTSTGEAFIKQVKKDVEIANDISEGHSLNGNTLGASGTLVLYVCQGMIPSLEVDTQAGAFNLGKIALPVPTKVIKDFGSADSKYYAILVDRRGLRLHNCYRAVRDQQNGDGDFLNIFLHTEFTAYASRNIFVKVYSAS